MTRTKEFDEEIVLQKAMKLFWEQGYEKTSINDLVEHMGIHRRSLYDTFGDKHQLYLMTVDRYGKRVNSALSASMQRSTSRQAVQFLFDMAIEGFGDESPPGCMFVNMAVELAPRDLEAEAKACEGFSLAEQHLAGIIRQGQLDGEFASVQSAEELSESLHNALLGLRVLSRTSTSKEKLHRIAKLSMEILDK